MLGIFIGLSIFLAIGKALAPTEEAKAEWQACKDHLDYGHSGSPGCAVAALVLLAVMILGGIFLALINLV